MLQILIRIAVPRCPADGSDRLGVDRQSAPRRGHLHVRVSCCLPPARAAAAATANLKSTRLALRSAQSLTLIQAQCSIQEHTSILYCFYI